MACDPSGDELDGGHEEPRGGAFDGPFEVLGETAVAVEPCEGALDHPAAGDSLEPLGTVGTLDDFYCPLAHVAQGGAEFGAGIPPIGEDMAQPGKAVSDRRQHIGRAIAILDVGRMDDGANQ